MKKGDDFINLIYAYKKKKENKIVYVGQTVCLETRHKQHVLYDPYNPNNKEYNYPLSRGIRKYGKEEYELIVLEENIPLELLDEREKYWIKYYNTYWDGYNQTTGGTFPTKPIYEENIVYKVIEMLRNEEYSYNDIKNKTGLSLTHIYNINCGKRRPIEGIKYPIRKSNTKGSKGLKFSQKEVLEIHNLILNTNKTFKEIAKEYNCSASTISEVNRGKTKNYKLNNFNYPLREKPYSVARTNYWINK